MRVWAVLGILMAFGVGIAAPALSDDWREQSGRGTWWPGDCREAHWDGPCKVQLEANRDEFKEEATRE